MPDLTTLTLAELLAELQEKSDQVEALEARVLVLERVLGAFIAAYDEHLKELLDSLNPPGT